MQFKLTVFHKFCSLNFRLVQSLALAFVCFISSVSAQESQVLETFTLVQSGNTVVASLTIKGGASCNGVTLERRLKGDLQYETAGIIQGVCGGSEFAEHYSIIDDSPNFSNINLYRLILGSTGKSLDLSINVIRLLDEYTIFPQPAIGEVFIKFDNPNNEAVTLKVYDSQGRKIKESRGLTNDLVFIDSSGLSSGLFVFQIEFSSSKLLSGRFIKS